MDIALFDFDGTITDREMFVAFLEHAVPRRRLALGKVFLAPLIVGYKLGVVPANTIRAAAVRVGLSGAPLQAVEHAATSFATDVLPSTVRPVALERIRWHQARGDRVVVVTGALELALRPWCDRHSVELVGSQLEHRGGRLTGRYSRPQCLGFYPEITDGCERAWNSRSRLATLRRILGLWNRSTYSNTSVFAASSVRYFVR